MPRIDYQVRALGETLRSIAQESDSGFEVLPNDGSAVLVVKLRSCVLGLRSTYIVFERFGSGACSVSDSPERLFWPFQFVDDGGRSAWFVDELGNSGSLTTERFAQRILDQLSIYCELSEEELTFN